MERRERERATWYVIVNTDTYGSDSFAVPKRSIKNRKFTFRWW